MDIIKVMSIVCCMYSLITVISMMITVFGFDRLMSVLNEKFGLEIIPYLEQRLFDGKEYHEFRKEFFAGAALFNLIPFVGLIMVIKYYNAVYNELVYC